MRAQVILGPGARESHLQLLRSVGLSVDPRPEFRSQDDSDLLTVLGSDGTIHRFLPELVRCN